MSVMVTAAQLGLSERTEGGGIAGPPRSGTAPSPGVRDILLTLGESRPARQLVRALGLPVPLPRRLQRTTAPWQPSSLAGASVVLGGAADSTPSALSAAVRAALIAAGAVVYEAGRRRAASSQGAPGGRLDVQSMAPGSAARALVFDASSVESPSELRALYDFFHPLLGRLTPHGRIVVLGRPSSAAASPTAAAACGALEGFMRSLAKETGRQGTSVQLLTVEPGSEARVEPVLRFLLSEHAAFVTGQSLPIGTAVRFSASAPFVRPLEGRVALVTGAARGIGAATVQRLAAEGAHVVCLDRPEDEALLNEVAQAVGGSPLACDVSSPAAPGVIARHLADAHAGVDVVVHNAGITRDKTLARMQPEQWDETLDINLAAATRIDAALDAGLLRDDARQIYLSSVVGIAGGAGQTNYASAKAGLIAYVRSRAQLLAARGIAANAVAPGFIETRMTAAMPSMLREAGRRLNCFSQGGLPEDVANAITFLASPGAAAISGAVLRVCGGALLGA
jgi:3-oxoacyl-[acyl-carrier protein] reductase